MKIEIEIIPGVYRQADAERQDDVCGYIWLRLPDPARIGLHKLLGNVSRNQCLALGMSDEEARATMDLYHSMT